MHRKVTPTEPDEAHVTRQEERQQLAEDLALLVVLQHGRQQREAVSASATDRHLRQTRDA